MMKSLVVVGVAILLAGCWPNERRIVSRGWVEPTLEADRAPLYCYRTLGSVDCHSEPLPPDNYGRLEGTYEPKPPAASN